MNRLIKVIILTLFVNCSETTTKSKFKSVKCTSLNETVAKIRYCYLKAYSRSYVSLNYGESRMLPLEKPVKVSFYLEKPKRSKIKIFLDKRVNQVSVRNDFSRNCAHRVWSLHCSWRSVKFHRNDFFRSFERHCRCNFQKMSLASSELHIYLIQITNSVIYSMWINRKRSIWRT